MSAVNEYDESMKAQALVDKAGLVECGLCGQYAKPETLTRCEVCGVQAHRGCMDRSPTWLCDTEEYVCGPQCEIQNLETWMKANPNRETMDRIARRLDELHTQLLPGGVAAVLLHLDALRSWLRDNEYVYAADTATEAMQMIRRLAHSGKAA